MHPKDTNRMTNSVDPDQTSITAGSDITVPIVEPRYHDVGYLE